MTTRRDEIPSAGANIPNSIWLKRERVEARHNFPNNISIISTLLLRPKVIIKEASSHHKQTLRPFLSEFLSHLANVWKNNINNVISSSDNFFPWLDDRRNYSFLCVERFLLFHAISGSALAMLRWYGIILVIGSNWVHDRGHDWITKKLPEIGNKFMCYRETLLLS